MHRKKGSRRQVLTTTEKLAIIHSAVVEQLPWKIISKEHRVSLPTISILVSKSKKNPKFLEEIHSKENEWNSKIASIDAVLDELIEKDSFIDSAQAVIEKLASTSNQKFKDYEVIKVMKNRGMSFRKVKHIPIGANSPRNLILRQRWLMALLDKDHKNRTYVNVDETWLGMSDFRRMKWQAP